MNTDKFGQQIFTQDDICDILLRNPSINIQKIITDKPIEISEELELTAVPEFLEYVIPNFSIKDFDKQAQNNWFMPESYKTLDIAEYVLTLCKTDAELQRTGEELLLFQKYDMFDLLRYLKYLVDTMRNNNIVWGVGRGSSVSSFVLFLIGVHKINSLYFGLSIDEFIK